MGYPVLASFEAHVEKRGEGAFVKLTELRASLRKPVSFTIKAPATEHPSEIVPRLESLSYSEGTFSRVPVCFLPALVTQGGEAVLRMLTPHPPFHGICKGFFFFGGVWGGEYIGQWFIIRLILSVHLDIFIPAGHPAAIHEHAEPCRP